MGESDWTAILRSAEILRAAYPTPPDPSECTLQYFQIDEREASVTVGFVTLQLPSRPPADWEGKKYNTVEFYLRFTNVKRLRVAGWDFTIRDAEVSVSRSSEGIQVALASEGSHIHFAADQCLVPRMRSYLSAQE
ncbi:Imm50 family immunity protein [Streptomyces lavendulocolor]|uniref:Imm50 family immunity protein n=1 Tax=Streptomyces lavendulocolor TaxID=67316 RepID=UPI00337AED99